jgi:polysaccharide export outer membrane protein
MVMRRLLILTTLIASLAACSPPPSNYPYEKEPDPRRSEYVIGVADRLSIRVWKNPELNTDIEVRPDGTITMPLLGDVRAVDITPTELKKEIGKALSQYIKEAGAVVTVAVTEVNAYKVTVSGNVLQPGVYPSRQFLTVADAVALAGGPNRFAKVNEVVLIRPNPKGGVRRIPIDYEAIQKGEQLRQNLVLIRGDTLFFP